MGDRGLVQRLHRGKVQRRTHALLYNGLRNSKGILEAMSVGELVVSTAKVYILDEKI